MKNSKIALSVLAIAAAASLTACGGGGDGGSSTAPAALAPAPAPAPVITAQGTAPAITADPLAIVYVPTDATSRGLSPHAGITATAAASLQVTTPEGAYKGLGGNQASFVSLTSGTIADVKGDGNYSIGRWTNGATSLGNISINQGAHYAVGKPLTIAPNLTVGAPDVKVNCTTIASTLPTAVSGNYPVGKLNSATATVDLTFASLNTFSLDVSIGSDAHATGTISNGPLKGLSLSAAGTFQIETLGTDATKPLLAVGYTIPSPSSGDVSGVVVLQCQ